MDAERKLTILHTNDFHNKLFPPQAAYIKQRRVECGDNSILVDSGDAISAGNVGVRIGGEPILSLMNDTGYDAMTMGNREFHVVDGLLRHKIGAATFPVLCANMKYQKEQGSPLPTSPYLIRKMPNGLRLGLVGVTVPMVTAKMSARVLSSFLFDDPVTTIAYLLPEIKEKADVVVALTHIGLQEDKRLANACPELDLIIGGHTHVKLANALQTEPVPILQAGWFGHYLGLVELAVDGNQVSVASSWLEDLATPRKSKQR